jgi:hypothetical protein
VGKEGRRAALWVRGSGISKGTHMAYGEMKGNKR